MNESELIINFNGNLRQISGDDLQNSTVIDLIYALAHETKQSGRFMMFLINKTESIEHLLSSDDVPYHLLLFLKQNGVEATLEVRKADDSEYSFDNDSQTTDSLRSWNHHNNESLVQMSDEEIRELIVQQDEILKKQAEMIVEIDNQFAEEETDTEFLQMLNQRRNLQRTLRNLRSINWEGLRWQRSEDLNLLKHQYNQLRLRLLAIKQQLERMRIEEITLIQEIESFRC
ncbi:hypothetical protein M3Y98_00321500 [Aphelenchoides besseyi]|nr:hypothetical protein M3Y98_00321500 [Aphelenchoides besseyi]